MSALDFLIWSGSVAFGMIALSFACLVVAATVRTINSYSEGDR